MKILRILLILLVIAVNIGCDQVSKYAVRNNLDYHENISLLDDNLVLTKVENTGAFLSLGDSLPPLAKGVLLTLLPTLTLSLLLFWLLRNNPGRWAVFGLCCIVGGGIGNIFDRIAYGSVTDFLYIEYGFFRTGIFNMADVSITAGTLMVVLGMLVETKKAVG